MASRSNSQSVGRSGTGSGSSGADDPEENQYTNPKYPYGFMLQDTTLVVSLVVGEIQDLNATFVMEISWELFKSESPSFGVKICNKIPHPVHEQLCKEDREASAAVANSAQKNQLTRLPPYEDSSSAPSAKKRKEKQTNIADSFTAEERHIADSHIARMFFTRGVAWVPKCCVGTFISFPGLLADEI